MGDLTQNKLFETEVRFSIPDIEKFRKIVNQNNLKLIKEYAFTDFYFKPTIGDWNSLEQTVRIRTWKKPDLETAIYLTKDEIRHEAGFAFKRSLYPEGKKILFKGSVAECKRVLEDLHFKLVYSIQKKQGFVWQNQEKELEFCAEETDVLGWTGEMEIDGTNLDYIKHRIANHMQVLQLEEEQLSYKPLAVLIEEKTASI